MTEFKILKFFNPIKKREVSIRAGAIAGFDFDGANQVNVIYTIGGVFPVQESIEEIRKRIESINSPNGQGEANVNNG